MGTKVKLQKKHQEKNNYLIEFVVEKRKIRHLTTRSKKERDSQHIETVGKDLRARPKGSWVLMLC